MIKNKLFIIIGSCILVALVLNVSMLLFINSYARALWGVITGGENADAILSQIVKWDALREFDVEYGNLAPENSKNRTFIFHLKNKQTSENLLLIHLDNLTTFSPKTIKTSSDDVEKSLVRVTDKHIEQGYSIVMTFPYTAFNINQIPIGDTLQILGIKPKKVIERNICGNQIHAINTDLNRFSFNSIPDKGFKKNVPITFEMWAEKKGSLMFLESSNKEKMLLIQYFSKNISNKEFAEYVDKRLQSFCNFAILRTK